MAGVLDGRRCGCRGLKGLRIYCGVLVLLFSAQVLAAGDLAAELVDAQAALAAGEYDRAYPLYLAVAEKGNPLAQFSVAMFHDRGWGRHREDRVKACQWYRKAAQGNIPAGAHFHAQCLDQGVSGTADPNEAARWYARAAELGHHMSWCDLAEMHMTGRGVSKDPEKAISLCRKAAELGAMPAYLRLGRWLLYGDESIRSPEAAHAWFEAVSQLPEAQYHLGVMHRDGLGTVVEPDEARQWFERAASQGYLPAYFQTASLYFAFSPDIKRNKPPADILAKTYMWLQATLQRSGDAVEREKATAMLDQVLQIMPGSWVATLDGRVSEHLALYPPSS